VIGMNLAKIFGEESLLEELTERLKKMKKSESNKCCNLFLVVAVIVLFLAFVSVVIFAVKLVLKHREEYEGFLIDDDDEDDDEDDDNDESEDKCECKKACCDGE